MTTQHTPTPWDVLDDAGGPSVLAKTAYGEFVICRMRDGRVPELMENAAFIVRAANSFDGFIVACQRATDEMKAGEIDTAIQTLRTVLEGAADQTLPEVR